MLGGSFVFYMQTNAGGQIIVARFFIWYPLYNKVGSVIPMAKTKSQNKPNTEFTFNPEAKNNKNSSSWKKAEDKKENK